MQKSVKVRGRVIKCLTAYNIVPLPDYVMRVVTERFNEELISVVYVTLISSYIMSQI